MVKFLADTNLLIDHLRKDEKAKTFLIKHLPAISHVTLAELIHGAKNKNELTAVESAAGDLGLIPISEQVSELAIDLMREFFLSHNLRFLDALVAATAIEEDLTLITSNTKHFSFVRDLKLQDWEEM